MPEISTFTQRLLSWHSDIDRKLPWKNTKDPYLIWLSEIIMQQTRVAQGTDYYLRLSTAYPTVTDLAKAPEDELMLLWQGLGYYSRARNLHKAAKIIASEYSGRFPSTYKDVLSLPGIGPYTAAAICGFAYEMPHAVVDGNVYRVLGRYFGIDTAIDTTRGQREFRDLSQKCLGLHQPSSYNQAIMDFGALQCTPKSPDCGKCPMISDCYAYQHDCINQLPYKMKSIKRRKRYFYYFLFIYGQYTFIKKRSEKDIWQGLYELPLIECDQKCSKQKVISKAEEVFNISDYSLSGMTYQTKHVLSHQDLITEVYSIKINEPIDDCVMIPINELSAYAFPVLLERFFDQSDL